MTDSPPEFILHHYDGSPFSEKLRLVLGFKRLAWRSVKVPRIMPKPDVVALTGGYRRTPLLQVGADVYCDTALAVSRLEACGRTLRPASAPLAPLLAQWADSTLFWTVIAHAMQPAGLAALFQGVPAEEIKAFGADRAAFTAGMPRQTAADAGANLGVMLAALDAQLADGRAWLFGADASEADFSVAHCLWYLRRAGPMAAPLHACPALGSWLDRVLAIGHGRPEPMDSAQALAVAAGAGTFSPSAVMAGMGFAAGDRVGIAPLDYGRDVVSGTLVGLDAVEAVVERHDPRAGTVHVHFPRRGYQILKDKT